MRVTIQGLRGQQIDFENLLFYLSYGIFLIFGILSSSFYRSYFDGTPYRLIRIACILILVFRELLIQRYSIRSIIIGVIFIILAILTKTQSESSTVTFILIYVFCARDLEFKTIARFSAWVTLIVLLFVVASAEAGILPNYVFHSGGRTRHYLGFRYALFPSNYLFNATGLFLYVSSKKKIHWLELIALAVLNYWFFRQTSSRLSFYLSMLLIVAFALLKIFPRAHKRLKVLYFVMIFAFLIGLTVSLVVALNYDSNVAWMSDLDSTLEGRLHFGKQFYEEYGFHLFGQEIHEVGNGLNSEGETSSGTYAYVDCLYIKILLKYGIIFTVVWMAILTYTMWQCYKLRDYPLMICMTVVAMHLVVDDLSLSIQYDTFWFASVVALTGIQKTIERRRVVKNEHSVCSIGQLSVLGSVPEHGQADYNSQGEVRT